MHRYVFEFQMPNWKKCLKALRNIPEKGYVFMEALLMAKDMPICTWMPQNRSLKQFGEKKKVSLMGSLWNLWWEYYALKFDNGSIKVRDSNINEWKITKKLLRSSGNTSSTAILQARVIPML